MAIILPGLMLMIAFSKKVHSFKLVLPSFTIVIMIALGYLYLRSSSLLATQESLSLSTTGLAILYVIGEYLQLLLFPISLKSLYNLPHLTLSDPSVIQSVLLICVWIIGLGVALSRSSAVAVGMAWVLISLVPSYSLVIYTSVSPMAERLLYLPSVGFSLLCGVLFFHIDEFFFKFGSFQWVGSTILVCMLSGYAIGTIYSNKAWADNEHLWKNTVQKNTGNSMARLNLANAYMDQHRWQEAVMEYENAISIKQDYPEAHYNIGNAYTALDRRDLAIQHYETAIRLKPNGHMTTDP